MFKAVSRCIKKKAQPITHSKRLCEDRKGSFNMKKLLCLLLALAMCVSLAACGESSKNDTEKDEGIITNENVEEAPAETEKETKKIFKKELTAEELVAQLNEQELKITSTKYVVQHTEYKSLYPDMMQVILQNDTEYDIKNAVVAFAAWDENNLPVKIKGSTDFSDGSYIKQCNYADINLIPGGTFGNSAGFQVDEACGIKTFKAIVVSYEAFTGEKWENPLYEDWCKLYEGVKLTPELMID